MLVDNIAKGLMSKREGKWSMTLHSYRSGFYPSRSIYTVSTSTYTYALLEDSSPLPPPPPPPNPNSQSSSSPSISTQPPQTSESKSQSKRTQFVTIPSPPDSSALPTLLSQISGNWTSSRQNNAAQSGKGVVIGASPQVVIEGHTFTIGGDWVVRIGNVIQGSGGVPLGGGGGSTSASGSARGMIIEAEYLPLSKHPSPQPDTGNGSLITEFLMTIVPKSAQHQILAVAVSPQQWTGILKSSDDGDEQEQQEQVLAKGKRRDDEVKSAAVDEDTKPASQGTSNDDNIFWMGDDDEEENDDMTNDVHPTHERERRSAYLILKCLQGERLL